MCGIIGMFCVDSVNQQIYDNLLLLQHRGQDSAGIVTMDNHTFHVHKQKGRVREAFRTETCESFWAMLVLVMFAMRLVVPRHQKRKFSPFM